MLSQPDDLIGALVAGRYRVKAQLGRGGMGTVFLAEHEAIHKKIALKVLHPEYSAKPDLVERFKREAISASRIKHINVLDVFDFGQVDNGCFFLAMEYLEGSDLADVLEQQAFLPADRILRIAMQICRALSAAHASGVVHRDLKPENVFLHVSPDGDELVKIVDFGIAQLRGTEEHAAASQRTRRRLTRTGMIFGTPEYMSPEQAAGKNADRRADVYAVGIMLYEMFTGAVPFTGETFFGVLNAHLNEPLTPMRTAYPAVQISPELEAIICRALDKDPDGRFQSMQELAAALASTPEGSAAGVSHPTMELNRPSSFPAAASAPGSPTAMQFRGKTADATADTQPDDTTVHERGERAAGSDLAAPAVTSVGRRVTQLDAETSATPRGKGGAGRWVIGAVVVAGVAVAGSVALLRQTAPTANPEATGQATSEPLAPSAAPTMSVVPTPSASAAPVVPRVTLSVETDPPGAVLYKDGAQVCDETPCEVQLRRDETAELEAKKGRASAKTKVLAQRDQKVKLRLEAAAAPGPRPAAPAAPCYKEVLEDGIKVLKAVPCSR